MFRIEPSTAHRNRIEKGLNACNLESNDTSKRDAVLSSVTPTVAVHVASSLIRRWFRELPQSIFADVDMSLIDASLAVRCHMCVMLMFLYCSGEIVS